MRERLAVASIATIALAGCSFLLSDDFAGEDPPAASEAGSSEAGTGDASNGGADTSAPADDGGANADAALDPSLLAFWNFDQTPSSVVEDQTGHGHTLVLTGAQVVNDAGKRGGALVFSGNQFAHSDSLD